MSLLDIVLENVLKDTSWA